MLGNNKELVIRSVHGVSDYEQFKFFPLARGGNVIIWYLSMWPLQIVLPHVLPICTLLDPHFHNDNDTGRMMFLSNIFLPEIQNAGIWRINRPVHKNYNNLNVPMLIWWLTHMLPKLEYLCIMRLYCTVVSTCGRHACEVVRTTFTCILIFKNCSERLKDKLSTSMTKNKMSHLLLQFQQTQLIFIHQQITVNTWYWHAN